MTFSPEILERDALDTLAPRLAREGYRLVRNPGPLELPEFLRGAHPDAIAIGGPPNLLIEVLGRTDPQGGKPDVEKIETLRSSLAGHSDWRLEIVYLRNSTTAPRRASSEQVQRRLEEISKSAREEPAGALLLAWSLLEAVIRRLEPVRAAKPLSASAMIELAVSMGHIGEADGAALRAMAQLRNAIAHGDLSAPPPGPADVERILGLSAALAAQEGSPSQI